MFALSRFRASFLAVNHLVMCNRTVFKIVEKLSTFFPEIMTLVSSSNVMGADKVFIVGERLFMHTVKCKSPRIDPWETSFFIVSQFGKIFGPFVFRPLDKI
jgi:hypothetical protein